MRRVLATGLVGLAAVLLVAAIFAVWADGLLLSPGHWETTSTRLLTNPIIHTSTATYLTDRIDARLDLAGLGSSLGSTLGLSSLAGHGVAAARTAIFHAVDTALGLGPVRALWAQANRTAATTVLTLVNGTGGPMSVNRDVVALNLSAVLQATAADAHLPAAVTTAVRNADGSTLTLVRSDHVHTVQVAGRTIRDLARWLLVLVPVLWLAALALARDMRRRTLAWIGISAAVAGGLVLAARAVLIPPASDAISANPSLRKVIASAIQIITSSLSHLALGVCAGGVVVAVVAMLAGRGAGESRRRRDRQDRRGRRGQRGQRGQRRSISGARPVSR